MRPRAAPVGRSPGGPRALPSTRQHFLPQDGWLALVLAIVTGGAYAPALRAAFVWNDSDYVTRPALQSWQGLWRIWFEVGATEQYYPLLHSSFWFQHRLWGDAPAGYHLLNVLLHVVAAGLLVVLLRRLAIPGAWLAGFVFALHPVAVESVAWISEQKNTLSLVFYLAAALAYLHFDANRRPVAYGTALFFFLLAILAKSVTVTLPAALLVVAWWRHGRVEWQRDVRPLLPWFLVALGLGLFSTWVELKFIGASGAEFALSPAERTLLAARVPWFYAGKLLWPGGLVFIYPRWVIDPSIPAQYLYLLASALALAGLWWQRRRLRGFLAVTLLFVGSLFPVLGFFNVYGFLFSYVADHWQYHQAVPVIVGSCALLAAGLRPFPRGVATGLAVTFLAALAGLTWQQAGSYRDLETLYRATLARNPSAWMAHNNLGTLLLETGRAGEALGHFEQAIAIKPTAAKALGNVAAILQGQGRREEARAHFEAAVKLDPAVANVRNNYATLLRELGLLDDALAQHAEAVRIDPGLASAHNSYSFTLRLAGRLTESIAQSTEAVALDPTSAPARLNLSLALSLAGRKQEAGVHYREAQRLNPALPAIDF